MLKIRGYERYQLNVQTMEIYRPKGDRMRALKGIKEGGHIYFYFWSNGGRTRISLWTIMQENWDLISGEIKHFRAVSMMNSDVHPN